MNAGPPSCNRERNDGPVTDRRGRFRFGQAAPRRKPFLPLAKKPGPVLFRVTIRARAALIGGSGLSIGGKRSLQRTCSLSGRQDLADGAAA